MTSTLLSLFVVILLLLTITSCFSTFAQHHIEPQHADHQHPADGGANNFLNMHHHLHHHQHHEQHHAHFGQQHQNMHDEIHRQHHGHLHQNQNENQQQTQKQRPGGMEAISDGRHDQEQEETKKQKEESEEHTAAAAAAAAARQQAELHEEALQEHAKRMEEDVEAKRQFEQQKESSSNHDIGENTKTKVGGNNYVARVAITFTPGNINQPTAEVAFLTERSVAKKLNRQNTKEGDEIVPAGSDNNDEDADDDGDDQDDEEVVSMTREQQTAELSNLQGSIMKAALQAKDDLVKMSPDDFAALQQEEQPEQDGEDENTHSSSSSDVEEYTTTSKEDDAEFNHKNEQQPEQEDQEEQEEADDRRGGVTMTYFILQDGTLVLDDATSSLTVGEKTTTIADGATTSGTSGSVFIDGGGPSGPAIPHFMQHEHHHHHHASSTSAEQQHEKNFEHFGMETTVKSEKEEGVVITLPSRYDPKKETQQQSGDEEKMKNKKNQRGAGEEDLVVVEDVETMTRPLLLEDKDLLAPGPAASHECKMCQVFCAHQLPAKPKSRKVFHFAKRLASRSLAEIIAVAAHKHSTLFGQQVINFTDIKSFFEDEQWRSYGREKGGDTTSNEATSTKASDMTMCRAVMGNVFQLYKYHFVAAEHDKNGRCSSKRMSTLHAMVQSVKIEEEEEDEEAEHVSSLLVLAKRVGDLVSAVRASLAVAACAEQMSQQQPSSSSSSSKAVGLRDGISWRVRALRLDDALRRLEQRCGGDDDDDDDKKISSTRSSNLFSDGFDPQPARFALQRLQRVDDSLHDHAIYFQHIRRAAKRGALESFTNDVHAFLDNLFRGIGVGGEGGDAAAASTSASSGRVDFAAQILLPPSSSFQKAAGDSDKTTSKEHAHYKAFIAALHGTEVSGQSGSGSGSSNNHFDFLSNMLSYRSNSASAIVNAQRKFSAVTLREAHRTYGKTFTTAFPKLTVGAVPDVISRMQEARSDLPYEAMVSIGRVLLKLASSSSSSLSELNTRNKSAAASSADWVVKQWYADETIAPTVDLADKKLAEMLQHFSSQQQKKKTRKNKGTLTSEDSRLQTNLIMTALQCFSEALSIRRESFGRFVGTSSLQRSKTYTPLTAAEALFQVGWTMHKFPNASARYLAFEQHLLARQQQTEKEKNTPQEDEEDIRRRPRHLCLNIHHLAHLLQNFDLQKEQQEETEDNDKDQQQHDQHQQGNDKKSTIMKYYYLSARGGHAAASYNLAVALLERWDQEEQDDATSHFFDLNRWRFLRAELPADSAFFFSSSNRHDTNHEGENKNNENVATTVVDRHALILALLRRASRLGNPEARRALLLDLGRWTSSAAFASVEHRTEAAALHQDIFFPSSSSSSSSKTSDSNGAIDPVADRVIRGAVALSAREETNLLESGGGSCGSSSSRSHVSVVAEEQRRRRRPRCSQQPHPDFKINRDDPNLKENNLKLRQLTIDTLVHYAAQAVYDFVVPAGWLGGTGLGYLRFEAQNSFLSQLVVAEENNNDNDNKNTKNAHATTRSSRVYVNSVPLSLSEVLFGVSNDVTYSNTKAAQQQKHNTNAPNDGVFGILVRFLCWILDLFSSNFLTLVFHRPTTSSNNQLQGGNAAGTAEGGAGMKLYQRTESLIADIGYPDQSLLGSPIQLSTRNGKPMSAYWSGGNVLKKSRWQALNLPLLQNNHNHDNNKDKKTTTMRSSRGRSNSNSSLRRPTSSLQMSQLANNPDFSIFQQTQRMVFKRPHRMTPSKSTKFSSHGSGDDDDDDEDEEEEHLTSSYNFRTSFVSANQHFFGTIEDPDDLPDASVFALSGAFAQQLIQQHHAADNNDESADEVSAALLFMTSTFFSSNSNDNNNNNNNNNPQQTNQGPQHEAAQLYSILRAASVIDVCDVATSTLPLTVTETTAFFATSYLAKISDSTLLLPSSGDSDDDNNTVRQLQRFNHRIAREFLVTHYAEQTAAGDPSFQRHTNFGFDVASLFHDPLEATTVAPPTFLRTYERVWPHLTPLITKTVFTATGALKAAADVEKRQQEHSLSSSSSSASSQKNIAKKLLVCGGFAQTLDARLASDPDCLVQLADMIFDVSAVNNNQNNNTNTQRQEQQRSLLADFFSAAREVVEESVDSCLLTKRTSQQNSKNNNFEECWASLRAVPSMITLLNQEFNRRNAVGGSKFFFPSFDPSSSSSSSTFRRKPKSTPLHHHVQQHEKGAVTTRKTASPPLDAQEEENDDHSFWASLLPKSPVENEVSFRWYVADSLYAAALVLADEQFYVSRVRVQPMDAWSNAPVELVHGMNRRAIRNKEGKSNKKRTRQETTTNSMSSEEIQDLAARIEQAQRDRLFKRAGNNKNAQNHHGGRNNNQNNNNDQKNNINPRAEAEAGMENALDNSFELLAGAGTMRQGERELQAVIDELEEDLSAAPSEAAEEGGGGGSKNIQQEGENDGENEADVEHGGDVELTDGDVALLKDALKKARRKKEAASAAFEEEDGDGDEDEGDDPLAELRKLGEDGTDDSITLSNFDEDDDAAVDEDQTASAPATNNDADKNQNNNWFLSGVGGDVGKPSAAAVKAVLQRLQSAYPPLPKQIDRALQFQRGPREMTSVTACVLKWLMFLHVTAKVRVAVVVSSSSSSSPSSPSSFVVEEFLTSHDMLRRAETVVMKSLSLAATTAATSTEQQDEMTNARRRIMSLLQQEPSSSLEESHDDDLVVSERRRPSSSDSPTTTPASLLRQLLFESVVEMADAAYLTKVMHKVNKQQVVNRRVSQRRKKQKRGVSTMKNNKESQIEDAYRFDSEMSFALRLLRRRSGKR